MLEGLVAWVLNSFLGEYVEDLNTDQLSIGIYSGLVELDNLPIRKDAFKSLELPLEVKSGFIGRIQLTIPWRRLRSEPWVITLEKLYLVAGPLKHKQYDAEKEKKAEQERKQAQLKALEEKWKVQPETVSEGGGSWWSYGTSLATNIIENLQLEVKDVHLRYEDDETIPGGNFACGVTIKNLSAQSTDANWVPQFVNRYATDMMHKLVDLSNFSLYWDTDVQMLGNLTTAELEDALQRAMTQSASSGKFKDHNYILEPVTAQAKMQRNTSELPLRSPNQPRITLDLQLDKLPVSLAETQYRGMVAMTKEFQRHDRARKYRPWRPNCNVNQSPRKWWSYAITATLHFIQDRNEKHTWKYATQRAQDNVAYSEAYRITLSKGERYLDTAQQALVWKMEEDLNFEELRLLRQVTMERWQRDVKATEETTDESQPNGDSSPTASVAEAASSSPTQPPEQQQQQLQGWFSGWSGWYGYGKGTGSTPTTPELEADLKALAQLDEASADEPPAKIPKTEVDQEIMGVLTDSAENNTLLKRDIVLARLHFCLQSGSFKLLGSSSTPGAGPSDVENKTLIELECSSIKMGLESRPRTHGLKFEISVGGLHLRDKMTANSIMPVLVAPQSKDHSWSQTRLFSGLLSGSAQRPTSYMQPGLSLRGPSPQTPEYTLFELIYESNPLHSKANFRLDIKTKPLDIVYNAAAIKRVKEFFTVKKASKSFAVHRSELDLAGKAQTRYEELKRQTKTELQQTWSRLLEDDAVVKAKRWDFNLDISAPQFLLPQDFQAENSTIVVLDLGHLRFQNVTSDPQEGAAADNKDDDDDDFVTPVSTPPQEEEGPPLQQQGAKKGDETESAKMTELLTEDMTETALHDRIYDKYALNLSDVQVMVGRARDNWRHAHYKGTSPMHVVEKFSISLQFERRLLYTTEAQWPKNILSGMLPSLVLHFSEQKIHTLRKCVDMMSDSTPTSPVTAAPETKPQPHVSRGRSPGPQHTPVKHSVGSSESAKVSEAAAESQLIMMQFSLNQVSVQVQSRDRSIAELQVTGVKAVVKKRPYDTSVNFTIHSLLVVDAFQTFGPDFELLVASHKNLCLDSLSGSIRDSHPSSPLSPQSPTSPVSPGSPAEPAKPVGLKQSLHSVQSAVSHALQSLVTSTQGTTSPTDHPSQSSGLNIPSQGGYPPGSPNIDWSSPVPDNEALITMDLDIITPACSNYSNDNNTTAYIANIQFNNLDFIANQETIVELLRFVHEISPGKKKTAAPAPEATARTSSQTEDNEEKDEMGDKGEMDSVWEITADFHRLNVLLVRVEGPDTAQKVATATLLEAKIQASIAQDLKVECSLGGLQLLNLKPSVKHQKVLSIGMSGDLPPLDTSVRMYKTAFESMLFDAPAEKAFNFTLVNPGKVLRSGISSPLFTPSGGQRIVVDAEMTLNLRMASMCYTHNAAFLVDLSRSIDQFQDTLKSSLKSAATEVAKGLVHSRPDLGSTTLYGSNTSLDASIRRKLPSLSDEPMEDDSQKFDSPAPSLKLKVDAVLQTPVVVIPRTPESSEVLVAHLGTITLKNSVDKKPSSTLDESMDFEVDGDLKQNMDRIYIQLKDMSMYSLNLDKQSVLQREADKHAPSAGTSIFNTPLPGGGLQTNYGTPILHDTVLELTIERPGVDDTFVNQSTDNLSFAFPDQETFGSPSAAEELSPNIMQITGRVVTPLQLVLSKQVYEQILQTMDHLTPEDDDDIGPGMDETSSTLLPDIIEEGSTSMEPSVSALKLDDLLTPPTSSPRDRAASTTQSSSVDDKPLVIKAQFEMQTFQVKMTGDLGEGEQGLVELKLQDFQVDFEKSDPYVKAIQVSLQSLLVEDLLQDADSKHRKLMVSFSSEQRGLNLNSDLPQFNYMSTSCPTSMIDVPVPEMPKSLPCSFMQENVFTANARKSHSATTSALPSSQSRRTGSSPSSECPRTPPPSRIRSRHDSTTADNKLVHIKVLLVDPKCPEFASKYNSTNRTFDIDFNCLDTVINLQTWVVLLDFIGMGAKVHNLDHFRREKSSMSRSASRASNLGESGIEKETVNTEVNLKVQSLALILNKTEYELAKAKVSAFNAFVSLRDGHFAIQGTLGAMFIEDQSPHGKMYRQRFTTTGSQALDFDIFKYGTPDPDLLRDHDISVKLRMSSVWYIHTHRFLQELLAFCQHFLQLQDVLGRMRAASSGQKISETATRGARISLDIQAGAPVLVVPHSSKSTDTLVLNMGNLSVHNTFLLANTEGTIAHRTKGPLSNSSSACTVTEASNPSCTDKSYDTAKSSVRSSRSDSSFLSATAGLSATRDARKSLDSEPTSHAPSHLVSKSSSSSQVSSLNSFSTAMDEHPPQFQRSQSQGSTGLRLVSSSSESQSDYHQCLLDVMSIELMDIDIFSAEWRDKEDYSRNDPHRDMVFPSFVLQRQIGKILKEKCRLMLQVERNLEGDISHCVPDFCMAGTLSSVHFSLDLEQLKLVKGLLAHNFGENLEEFQRPMMSHLQDPKQQTILSGDVWKVISISLDLHNVTVELLIAHDQPEYNCPEASLAKIDFLSSKLVFDSYSDGTKDVDLVSNEIRASDTRYRESPANVRPNVFYEILKPSDECDKVSRLQLEVHFRSTKEKTLFTILLNNMRLMGIFDWLLACKEFLLTGPVDPFTSDDAVNSMAASRTRPSVAVSPGVITKRATVAEKVETAFELKLNVTDTELVVVENTKDKDTNAIILKCTAVLSHRPGCKERPLACSLQSLEVFSCSLSAEDETALSILDPMVVTVELNGRSGSQLLTSPGPSGLLDATSGGESPPILEVSFGSLNVRLSYNDVKLFMAILNSMPQQLLDAQKQAPAKNAPQAKQDAWKISKLQDLGFRPLDCEKALLYSKGHLEDAAMWLTQNATPLSATDQHGKQGLQISGFEVRAGNICVCLIDDCLDADVPLAELAFSQVNLLQKFQTQREGRAQFKLSGDYYNRDLSGWEPFLETWGCRLSWQQGMSEENKLSMQISALDKEVPLNLVATTSLLDLYSKTKVKWTEDYYQKESAKASDEISSLTSSRRRVPFVPFAVKNNTGCRLWFATVTTTPNRIEAPKGTPHGGQHNTSDWRMVLPSDELPFLIEEREKIRHKSTHELKIHQLVVRVEGWQQVAPVSMDRVGVYFRQAEVDLLETASPVFQDKVPARIVFEVKREGSARKIITVRSALTLHNRLEDDIEVQLARNNKAQQKLTLAPSSRLAVPVPLVHCQLFMRPSSWSLDWCKQPITWQEVTKPGRHNDFSGVCDTRGGEKATYRFCVSVYRQHFPVDNPQAKRSSSTSLDLNTVQPGHVITVLPPVRLENLLPLDMSYYLKNTQIKGSVKPGKIASLVGVDLDQPIELGVHLENFPRCHELVIPPHCGDYRVKLRLFDTKERQLDLLVILRTCIGGSLKISILAMYWLVNKSGVPLIFRQDGTSKPAAGQFEEHELARSVVPLLFSYVDKGESSLCLMRLGHHYHKPGTRCKWCPRFMLERGAAVRELHVHNTEEPRPDLVYNIGIEVRQGRGRYQHTNIVTFAPRYQLDNRSRYKLAFAQRHLATRGQKLRSGEILSALPDCKLSFHWPRVDLDQLLCVCIMDDVDCEWSGGFLINSVDSFHINMRGRNGTCLFLRADIVLQGATFFIVFTDADHMPPPYRIDNFSEVPIQYYQTVIEDDSLRHFIKAGTSVPYAWDEPTKQPHLTLAVQGGSRATYNMNVVKAGENLYYKNFIYIAFTATFKGSGSGIAGYSSQPPDSYNRFVESQELVLDVAHPNRVVLKRKEPGKRSQLWRMTSTGMLEHEGSTVPRDPKRQHSISSSSSSSSSSAAYVLDIFDIALQPGVEQLLTLRKPDERRKTSQQFMFTEDGRLCCQSSTKLCVQPKDGIFGLRDSGEAVIGPAPPSLQVIKEIPPEMAVGLQKMKPGSGCLTVQVLMDGPTRVLQVADMAYQRQRNPVRTRELDQQWVMVGDKQSPTEGSTDVAMETQEPEPKPRDLQIQLQLPAGLGISLVSNGPEELLYISLKEIHLDYISTEAGQLFDAAVKNIQIDNQQFGNTRPVLLFVTPKKSDVKTESMPALDISAHKLQSGKWNADIYKHLYVTMKRMTLQIEERLLWKLLQFAGYNQADNASESLDENSFDSQRTLRAATSSQFKRYYFGALKVNTSRIILSMLTADELPPDLLAIKRSQGIPLVRFEEAKVELDPFIQSHPFETRAFLLESLRLHYTEELKSQAIKILGAVDFLGNPVGLFNDVTEGISGLVKDGNVGGLFKNVTHGVSDTAAKMTGSLSDGFGRATFDTKYQKKRQQLKEHSATSTDHLVAGVKGLGYGIFGGVTSIITQTYKGATNEGPKGLVTGLGKGFIGTFTKPVTGVLDLASGAASAVRDTSKGISRQQPPRMRPPRCCHGPGGLLPAYSKYHAEAQEFLFLLNNNDYTEIFITIEQLRFGAEDKMQVLVSNQMVRFLGRSDGLGLDATIVLKVPYDDLYSCMDITKTGDRIYLEIIRKAEGERSLSIENPTKTSLVRCDSSSIAKKVAQQINYAKTLYDETQQTLPSDVKQRS